MKKNRLYTTIAIAILIAFLFLTNAGLGHHHDDGASHQECQVCILISIAGVMIITSVMLTLSRQGIFFKFTPEQNSTFYTSYFKLNYPDRAPPRQNT